VKLTTNKITFLPPPLRPLPEINSGQALRQEGKRPKSFFIINMKTINRKNLKEKRKKLRNNPTQAEAFLWGYLKNSQLDGRKFRRQSSIKNYIVDFYCPVEKLLVELDGDFHFDEKAMKDDERRTRQIEEDGIKVVRFENQEVLLNLDSVLSEIKNHFKYL
jgi:very-short-patch-repair endonuclease